MEWIYAAPDAPYFVTESGAPWTPVGHNDAITWPTLQGCFRRKDLASADQYLDMLARHNVTVIRLMLEYSQGNHRYLERPVGSFHPAMVRLWDDLFALCEKHGIRVLLTPYDTFWMWIRWKSHPYNRRNGGPTASPSVMLTDRATRDAIKRRLEFVTTRWGGSGALFAWDLWNEIHPAHGNNSSLPMYEFIEDLSSFLKQTERRLYGRAHPQTVSIFGPVITTDAVAAESVLRHPSLDFASTHFYEEGTIDHPRNTVDAAVSTGALVRTALAQTTPGRPFFDSESGPIHTFKDKRRVLPEPFDDEYFRHMQWAHFASGGAGGGMRWPNRRPHTLTAGMHRAQQSLSGFLPLIDWPHFRRVNWNEEVTVSEPGLKVFACGDQNQAIVWLLRSDTLGRDGRLQRGVPPVAPRVRIPGLGPGSYRIIAWETSQGVPQSVMSMDVHEQAAAEFTAPALETDLAFAIVPLR